MRTRLLELAVLIVSLASFAAAEEHGCCSGCGAQCCLKPVCRLVCEQKSEVEVVYDCHCEDFCTMGPSQKCGHVCEPDCHGHTKTRTLWQPSCGHVRRRHVLVRHEVAKEVPHYKCVVEYVCDRCCCQGGRVPCDEASRLEAAAQEMNAAADQQAGHGPAIAPEPPAAPPKRSLLWVVLFGKPGRPSTRF
jgi:hypothetical protein